MSTEPVNHPALIVPVRKLKSFHHKLPAERFVHVAMRLLDRGGIEWQVTRVEALEAKINTVLRLQRDNKQPPALLPTKIANDKNGLIQYWRVMIAGAPHTFVWSTIANGLISYRGPGELTEPAKPYDKIS